MNAQQIYDFLDRTGHLDYPSGIKQVKPIGPCTTAIKTAEAAKAIHSFQEFEAELMDRLCIKHHSRSARFDGEIGPATIEAMQAPRCGHPDYGPNVQPAIGDGGWAGCHDIGNFHCATVHVDDQLMPSFLKPVFKEVQKNVQASYDDIGLRWKWVESADANIQFSFVKQSNGWIGLAIVGQAESCSSSIWCKFLATYKPSNILNEWITLIRHELGHNCGLSHSRGGVMNPSIVPGLTPTWRGDPSEPLLVRMYGGKPIFGNEPDYWTHQGMKSSKGKVHWIPLANPILIGE